MHWQWRNSTDRSPKNQGVRIPNLELHPKLLSRILVKTMLHNRDYWNPVLRLSEIKCLPRAARGKGPSVGQGTGAVRARALPSNGMRSLCMGTWMDVALYLPLPSMAGPAERWIRFDFFAGPFEKNDLGVLEYPP